MKTKLHRGDLVVALHAFGVAVRFDFETLDHIIASDCPMLFELDRGGDKGRQVADFRLGVPDKINLFDLRF